MKSIPMQTILTILDLLYPDHYIEVSPSFTINDRADGLVYALSKEMRTRWTLYVKGKINHMEFDTLEDLIKHLTVLHNERKLTEAQ